MQGKKLYFKAKCLVNFDSKTAGFILEVIPCSLETNLRVGSSWTLLALSEHQIPPELGTSGTSFGVGGVDGEAAGGEGGARHCQVSLCLRCHCQCLCRLFSLQPFLGSAQPFSPCWDRDTLCVPELFLQSLVLAMRLVGASSLSWLCSSGPGKRSRVGAVLPAGRWEVSRGS